MSGIALSGFKSFPIDPQPQRRIGDEIHLFPVHRIVAVLQLRGVVFPDHLIMIRRAEAHAGDLFTGYVLYRVGNGKSPVRRTVDQMGRRAHVVPQVLIFGLVELFQRVQPAAVAVLADELVDLPVLAEFRHTGG